MDIDAPTVAPHQSQTLSASIGRGTVVDTYRIESEIARGAMGIVYRATQLGLGRCVALKMILDADRHADVALKRFANEARAAASLDHPNIVPVYDVGTFQNFPYYTMALIEGESLASRLTRGPLPPRTSAAIAMRVASAADHAHQHQVIHRDLKPANVILDAAGVPYVTDFGVSKTLTASCDLTENGEIVGTPHYMPPEQTGGHRDAATPTADVYSIGAILYAMTTGRPPFQAATPIEVISQVISAEPVPPSKLNATVPQELEIITLKCLSKFPRDRYPTAGELSDDLERFLTGQPILARPPALLRRVTMMLRRHVVWASVSGSAAMLLVVLSCLVVWSLFRTQARVMELEDEMAIANQTVNSERNARSQTEVNP